MSQVTLVCVFALRLGGLSVMDGERRGTGTCRLVSGTSWHVPGTDFLGTDSLTPPAGAATGRGAGFA